MAVVIETNSKKVSENVHMDWNGRVIVYSDQRMKYGDARTAPGSMRSIRETSTFNQRWDGRPCFQQPMHDLDHGM
jgi:hypothetical protein